MTDEQIRKIMQDDPEAAKFLGGILPDQERHFESVVVNQVREKKEVVKVKTVKKKQAPLEGYKWPYYDSYVPGLGMNDKDKRIVRRGI